MPTPIITGTRVGGFAKFGWIPGGALPAGRVFSNAVEMLWITFGSALSVDMITNSEVP